MRLVLVFALLLSSISSFAQAKEPKGMGDGFYDYKVGDVIKTPMLIHHIDGGQRLVINDSINGKDSIRVIADFLKQHHNLVVELRAHTDCRGNEDFNRDLSDRKAEMVSHLLTEWFQIPDSQLSFKGMGESDPFMSCEEIAALESRQQQEAEHQRNRRYDIKVVSTSRFDTAKALNPKSFSSDSIAIGDYIDIPQVLFHFDKTELLVNEKVNTQDSLKLLAEWLIFHPELVIEIRNHSDARWSDHYSYSLQQARANAVKDYLVELGIPENRLVAKGYDDQLQIIPEEKINKMPNEREKEAAHAINRRTEILVIADHAISQ